LYLTHAMTQYKETYTECPRIAGGHPLGSNPFLPAARSILSSKTNLDDATLRSLLDSQEFSETLKDVMLNRE